MTSSRLSNFFFDGNHRASRLEVQPVQDRTLTDRERFLVQAEKQRVERDRQRRLVRIATVLQAHFRGARRRELFHQLLRSKFDAARSDNTFEQLQRQTSLLRLFFRPDEDSDRLRWLCSQLQSSLGKRAPEVGHFFTADWPSWLTGQLLVCCLRTISYATATLAGASVDAPVLRILERGVKTADERVLRSIMPRMDMIMGATNGGGHPTGGARGVDYTSVLLQLLCSLPQVRQPRADDVAPKLPGAHAQALFELMLLPLEQSTKLNDSINKAVHGSFALSIFCSRPSLAARLHVFPALGTVVSTKLRFDALLDSLLRDDWLSTVGNPQLGLSTLLRPCFADKPYLSFGLLALLRHVPTTAARHIDGAKVCAALAASLHFTLGLRTSFERLAARSVPSHDQMEVDDDVDGQQADESEAAAGSDDDETEGDDCSQVHSLSRRKLAALDVQSDDYVMWAVYDCLQQDTINEMLTSTLTGAVQAGTSEDVKTGARLLAAIIHLQSRHVLAVTNNVNTAHQAIVQSALLRSCVVGHGGSLMIRLWDLLKEVAPAQTPLFGGAPRTLLDQLSSGVRLCAGDADNIFPQLHVFCCVLRNVLCAVHDDECWSGAQPPVGRSIMPMSLQVLRQVASVLRNAVLGMIDAAHPDTLSSAAREDVDRQSALYGLLFQMTSSALRLLHERDQRLHFCGDGFWSGGARTGGFLVPTKMFIRRAAGAGGSWNAGRFAFARFLTHAERLRESLAPDASTPQSSHEIGDVPRPAEMRNLVLVTKLPFLVPFMERVQLFTEIIKMDKSEEMAMAAANPRNFTDADHEIMMHHNFGMHRNTIDIRVRRTHLFEDAFDRLMPHNQENVKGPIRVQMTNWAGLNEPGIDGGGIFREFLSELLKEIFDPGRGLFLATPVEGLIYPNPLAMRLHGDWQRQLFFAGRMLGKLIYERLMCELRFASCMIALLQRPQSALEVHHLKELDPVLYKNLLSLKSFEGDVATLHLDFSVVVDNLGVYETIDLIPDGRSTVVTRDNLLLYVEEVAKFYLNKQLWPCVEAVRAGVCSVLRSHWLSIFACNELQTLISGVDAELDVSDMRANTEWHRSRAPDPHREAADNDERLQSAFWRVVSSLDSRQQRALLRFVTGCSRPPLTGFKDLHPKLGVQIVDDATRLPTAATCMNLLKLPRYKDEDTLRSKLVYAISSGAGFELS